MSSQKVQLGAIGLTHPVFNSAGPWVATKEDLQAVAASSSAAVLTKSFSTVPWEGNPAPNVYVDEHYAINSIGLRNSGVDYFLEAAQGLTGKPLIANIVGHETSEYVELTKKLNNSPYDAIEVNLSCPNVSTKEPIGFSPERTAEMLREIMQVAQKPVGVKLPPYISRSLFHELAMVVQQAGVNHVVLLNAYPLAAAVDQNGRPHIVPNDGVGGLSGTALKPISLAHVLLFRQYTDGEIPIVGVGGISTRADVRDYLAAGATAVQVGTAILQHGVSIFDELS